MMADATTNSVEIAELGARIRMLRHERQMTLQKLSGQTGISVGMLSQMETGRSFPTIRTLQMVAHALGVTLGWFFPPEQSQARPPWVFPRSRRQKVAPEGTKISIESLTRAEGGEVELLLVTIEPGGFSVFTAQGNIGEDVGVVLEGRLLLEIDGVPAALERGDTFRLSRSLPYRFENKDDHRAKVLWANTQPFRSGLRW